VGHKYMCRYIEYKCVYKVGGGAFAQKKNGRMPNCVWFELNYEWHGHVASHLKTLNKVGADAVITDSNGQTPYLSVNGHTGGFNRSVYIKSVHIQFEFLQIRYGVDIT
jgi:hypothetical protein